MHFNFNFVKLFLLSSSLYAVNGELAKIFNECINPGEVAITFDDGPQQKSTPKLLDYLKSENIKATFFINGKNYGNIEENPETQAIIKREIEEGHDIGSHTFFHRNCFTALEEGSLKENIERLEKGIKKLINRTPRFFRPPLGDGGYSEEYCKKINIPYDPRTEIIRSILGGDGYKYGPDYDDYDYDIILWSADSEDWKCDGSSITYQDSLRSLDSTLKKADPSKDSFIILFHDVYEYTVTTVLPKAIEHVRELGYKIVPLSECIGRNPYKESDYSISSADVESVDNTTSSTVINSVNNGFTTSLTSEPTSIGPSSSEPTTINNNATDSNSSIARNSNQDIDKFQNIGESSASQLNIMSFTSIIIILIMTIYYHY